jgi:hypothetical protein
VHEVPVPPTVLVPALSLAVETVILRALEISSEKRFANVTAFLTALEEAALPEPPAFPFAHLTAGSQQDRPRSQRKEDKIPLLLPPQTFVSLHAPYKEQKLSAANTFHSYSPDTDVALPSIADPMMETGQEQNFLQEDEIYTQLEAEAIQKVPVFPSEDPKQMLELPLPLAASDMSVDMVLPDNLQEISSESQETPDFSGELLITREEPQQEGELKPSSDDDMYALLTIKEQAPDPSLVVENQDSDPSLLIPVTVKNQAETEISPHILDDSVQGNELPFKELATIQVHTSLPLSDPKNEEEPAKVISSTQQHVMAEQPAQTPLEEPVVQPLSKIPDAESTEPKENVSNTVAAILPSPESDAFQKSFSHIKRFQRFQEREMDRSDSSLPTNFEQQHNVPGAPPYKEAMADRHIPASALANMEDVKDTLPSKNEAAKSIKESNRNLTSGTVLPHSYRQLARQQRSSVLPPLRKQQHSMMWFMVVLMLIIPVSLLAYMYIYHSQITGGVAHSAPATTSGTPSVAIRITPVLTPTIERTPVPTPTPKPTSKPTVVSQPADPPVSVIYPASKPTPAATSKPAPAATSKPAPTATPKPAPTATPKPTATATPKPTATAQDSIQPWVANNNNPPLYNPGDEVTYDGHTYKCLRQIWGETQWAPDAPGIIGNYWQQIN